MAAVRAPAAMSADAMLHEEVVTNPPAPLLMWCPTALPPRFRLPPGKQNGYDIIPIILVSFFAWGNEKRCSLVGTNYTNLLVNLNPPVPRSVRSKREALCAATPTPGTTTIAGPRPEPELVLFALLGRLVVLLLLLAEVLELLSLCEVLELLVR